MPPLPRQIHPGNPRQPQRAAPLLACCLAGLSLLSGGCAGVAPESRLDQAGLEVPGAWSTDRTAAAGIDRAWLARFRDRRLSAMVDEAMQRNPDLQATAINLEIARQNAALAGAGRRPTIDLNLEGRRAQQNFIGFPIDPQAGGQGGAPGGDVLSSRSNTFGVSLNSSWELDIWGRVRAGEAAALAELEAVGAEFRAARASLAAQIAKAWFALIEAQQQRQLADETLASLNETEEVIRQRFEAGEAGGRGTGTDLRLARVDVAATEAVLQQREEQIARARRQLEALLGRYPAGSQTAPTELPAVPARPPAGLPSELLLRRPDLQAAERRFAAQGSRVREARLAVFPRFTLTGSGGTSTDDLAEILNSDFGVWSLAGQVVQPIIAAGQIRAEYAKRQAEDQQALRQLQAAVLQAFLEVETALGADHWLARQEEALARTVELAREADTEARANFRDGTGDILTVFEAQARLLDARSQLISVRRTRLDNRVDLHLALGGDFSPQPGAQP